VEVGAEQRLLFLNCEKFQTARNLETMRRYERTDLLHHPPSLALASNVLTIRQTAQHRFKLRIQEGKNDPQKSL
jgi:hypothetical protein